MAGTTRFLQRHRWVPAVVWAVAIMAVSSIPSPSIGPPLFPGCDKIAHFIEYFVLGAALRHWTRATASAASGLPSSATASARASATASQVVWAWAGWIGFAALDEIHQRFIPGREMSFWDFAADVGGLVAGYLVWQRARRVTTARHDREARRRV
jgi:VanZ family protein